MKMKDIDDIRRSNLRLLEQEFGGSAAASNRAGMTPAQFINLRNGAKDSKTGKPRGMRKETARRIESAFNKPSGWLDENHSSLDPSLLHTQPDKTNELITRYNSASYVKKNIVDFILSSNDEPSPNWVDSDVRAYLTTLEVKVSNWLSSKEAKKRKA